MSAAHNSARRAKPHRADELAERGEVGARRLTECADARAYRWAQRRPPSPTMKRPSRRTSPAIALTWQQFTVLLAGLVLLPVATCVVYEEVIGEAYLEEFIAPRLRRDFGFSVGHVAVRDMKGEQIELEVITNLQPGSPLERSGLRVGDVPFGFHRGGLHRLYSALLALQKGSPQEKIEVVNVYEMAGGRKVLREIVLRAPPSPRE